jgi:hypothetical protein
VLGLLRQGLKLGLRLGLRLRARRALGMTSHSSSGSASKAAAAWHRRTISSQHCWYAYCELAVAPRGGDCWPGASPNRLSRSPSSGSPRHGARSPSRASSARWPRAASSISSMLRSRRCTRARARRSGVHLRMPTRCVPCSAGGGGGGLLLRRPCDPCCWLVGGVVAASACCCCCCMVSCGRRSVCWRIVGGGSAVGGSAWSRQAGAPYLRAGCGAARE